MEQCSQFNYWLSIDLGSNLGIALWDGSKYIESNNIHLDQSYGDTTLNQKIVEFCCWFSTLECLDSIQMIAVEEPTYVMHNWTATAFLHQLLGALISICCLKSIPYFKYNPAHIKKIVTGNGKIDKKGIKSFLRQVYGESKMGCITNNNERDAILIGLCHIKENKL